MPGARLADLNSAISCVLCGGYLVNATTLVECLHSFCKVCIVRYLDTSKLCPICDLPVHKSKPLQYIRVDNTLQDIVYKVVPGLYQKEMKKRRDFYEKHPGPDANVSCPEDRGVVDSSRRLIFSPDDTISVSLEYCAGKQEQADKSAEKSDESTDTQTRRFLSCPAAFTVGHLHKFIRMKYSLEPRYKVDILYMDDVLFHGYSLMDIAYIYSWKRECPLRLFFRIYTSRPPVTKALPAAATTEALQAPADEAEGGTPKQLVVEAAAGPPMLSEPTGKTRSPSPPPCAPEQVDKAGAKCTPEPAAAVPGSVPSPEEPTEAIATVAPAAEPHALETPEMKTSAEEESTAPGSPKAVALVQSASPQQQKATEPPAEAQSPPPLPKITISALDKNSHKILIHTQEVPPFLAQASSPPPPLNGQARSPPSGKKSKRKEQRDVDRHQSKRKSPEKSDKRTPWCRSPPEESSGGSSSAKKLKLDGCDDAVEVNPASSVAVSSPLRRPDKAALPEPAKHNVPKSVPSSRKPPPPPAHPKTPPRASVSPSMSRHDEETRPLDLSVSHRGVAPQEAPRRPRGRPPLPLPTVMPLPLVTKRPSPPPSSSYSAPAPLSLFHKPTTPPAPSSSHHHHHHHRGNSKSFLKGANLTCINPDPNAFHPRIVIKNVPPRSSANSSAHRV
ncbi:uncharacterized protein LOC144170824 isoform X2 [Haemaphysalis longicornis]